MKITKKTDGKKEIEIGEKGDLILVRAKGRDSYAFGKLEDVVKHPDSHGNMTSSIKFDGDSYLFRSNLVFGTEFLFFNKRTNPPSSNRYEYSSSRYFNVDLIEEVVSGIDNIIAYLKNHPQEDKRKYIDLLKRIKDTRK